jgi:hypothetical protein
MMRPTWQLDEMVEGQAPPDPTLIFPAGVLEAIVAAGTNLMPPDRAQAEHLKDAVKVRDVLLGLVADAHPQRPALLAQQEGTP